MKGVDMAQGTISVPGGGVNDFIDAYESALARDGRADLGAFLPGRGDARFVPVLCELVRVELERGWEAGRPTRLEGYRRRFPELFADPAALRAVAFEEYRLRRQAGEPARPDEYAARYGVPTAGWPAPVGPPTTRFFPGPASDPGEFSLNLAAPAPCPPEPFPEVGGRFLDFRLVGELGRGAFGRVYLAEQAGLAGRRVALKLSTHTLFAEPQTLARLQHTHIVPVYSAHRAGPVEAVCMPYLGSATLAHLLDDLRGLHDWPESGKQLVETLAGHKAPTVEADTPAAAAGPAPAPPAPVLQRLQHLNYVEAVLWIGSCLADGLAHAHERGILHRDLKPANVLVTDDGTPMLLDFNLAEDARRDGPDRSGGTPQYMAPEQLAGVGRGEAPLDGRADVYGLGVILFELLTGRHPFPQRAGPLGEAVPLMLADRLAGPPRLQPLNAKVSPAAEAIVRRCLAPDPDDRYQSSRQLQEDLERQLAHRPLAHTREPSARERLAKWRRRHPRLATAAAVGAVALAALLGALGVAEVRDRRAKRLEAELGLARAEAAGSLARLRDDARPVQYLLLGLEHQRERLEEGIVGCRRVLGPYGVADDPGWEDRLAVRHLGDDGRRELREHLADLLLLQARAVALLADGSVPALREALRLNERAEACLGDGPGTRAVWEQRAGLRRRLGDEAGARSAADRAGREPLETARDYFLAGAEQAAAGHSPEAVPLLREAARRDPRHFWSWLVQGACQDRLGRDADAAACYAACTALWPESPWPYFRRGVIELRRGQANAARADFDTVLRLRPDMADAHINRALAELKLQRPAAAAEDLTRALELGTSLTRVYLLRSKAREQAGDAAGARADREEGLRREPGDAESWVARGLERAGADPAGALADFDAALKLDPRYLPAWQNKAYVNDEKLHRLDKSIEALDAALRGQPDAVDALGGRGVLLARLGRRDAALRDAAACLRASDLPGVLYQVAGVYAQTSRTHPDDRKEAFRLLSAALRQGFGLDLLETDHDLDPVRGLPEFKRLVDAARALGP
jgi:serine/threonine protein kinase/predicted Zn-dependent protease